MAKTSVYVGEELGRYGFPGGHPFGPDRMHAFWREACARNLDQAVSVRDPVRAAQEAIERFHTAEYVSRVASAPPGALLDAGDTPAFDGCFSASSTVVGSALDGLARVMDGQGEKAFVPIAGLHHAARHTAAGFCIFNDCGVVIETARSVYGLRRVAYVDIDAHHGDGVFYAFEEDPDLLFADIHEDGRYLYPGTGHAHETGRGKAKGTKLNLPVMPGATDDVFDEKWAQVEAYLTAAKPELILLQCGADSVKGDPVTHMAFTPAAHGRAAAALCKLADRLCDGRLLVTGGGGYNRSNLAAAWSNVLEALIAA